MKKIATNSLSNSKRKLFISSLFFFFLTFVFFLLSKLNGDGECIPLNDGTGTCYIKESWAIPLGFISLMIAILLFVIWGGIKIIKK